MNTTSHILRVPPEADGWRLDQFVSAFLGDYSRSFIQKLIRQGQVTLDGRPGKPATLVHAGERVEVILPPPTTLELQPEPIPLDILYEDDVLVVVNKPAGMSVHPGAGRSEGTLVHALLAHCDSLSAIGGVDRPGIVHRLDKDTSGVLVVAKTDQAHRDLSDQFRRHTIGRRYLALVCGVPARKRWTMDNFIGRSRRDRKKMTVVEFGGRRAVTHFEVVEAFDDFALVAARPETGRTHQIRVHLTHAGYPVVGDPIYGGGRRRALKAARTSALREALSRLNRQALHAERLAFLHPVTREWMEFTAPLPGDMQTVLDRLRA